MSTSLARQLQSLRTKQKDELKLPKKAVPSLLFDVADAAHLDENILYPLALSGLEQLFTINPSITNLASMLLDPSSKSFNRFIQPIDELKEIDTALESLIKLLAPHFILPSCHKVFEYLIRIYDIHVYQKEILINSLLPFIENPLFVRMAQLLNLKDHPAFGFMEPRIKKGNMLNRELLIKEIAKSPQLLGRICNFSIESLSIHSYYMNFATMLILQLINIVNNLSSDHLRTILAYVSESIKNLGLVEGIADGVLAVSLQLTNAIRINSEFTAALFVDLIKMTKSDELQTKIWKVIACSIQSNENIGTLPKESMQELFGRNAKLMAEDHESLIDEYEMKRYGDWLGRKLGECLLEDYDFLMKIKWTEKRLIFLNVVLTALTKAKNKTAKSLLHKILQELERIDTYALCKWMQSFFTVPENMQFSTYPAFTELKSFRVQFITKEEGVISLHSKGKDASWNETLLSHLEEIDPKNITPEDKTLLASIVKVIDDHELLPRISKLKILSKIFNSKELLDFRFNLCEELAGAEEFKPAFKKYCKRLSKQKDTILNKELMMILSAALNPDLVNLIIPGDWDHLGLFKGAVVSDTSNKETLNLLKTAWKEGWKLKAVDNSKVAEYISSCFMQIPHNEALSYFDLINEYIDFLLKLPSKVTVSWALPLLNALVSLLPSIDKIPKEQLEGLKVILEDVYLFFIGHKECHKSIVEFLNKHFKTHCMAFHLSLVLKHPKENLIKIITLLIKGQTNITSKLPLTFGVLALLNSKKKSIRRTTIELVKVLVECNQNIKNPLQELREFWGKFAEDINIKEHIDDITNDAVNTFLQEIINHEDEIILDKDQIMTFIPSTSLGGYFILSTLYCPVKDYVLFSRANHSVLYNYFLMALNYPEQCGSIKTLVSYIKPFISSEHFDVLNKVLKHLLSLKQVDKENVEATLILANEISKVTESYPSKQEVKAIRLIISVLKNSKFINIKGEVQSLVSLRTPEAIANYIKELTGALENKVADLCAIYEAILLELDIVKPNLIQVSIGLLEEIKQMKEENVRSDKMNIEYMLELLFSFIGKHITQHKDLNNSYKTLILEFFKLDLAQLFNECQNTGPTERTLRSLNTEIFSSINIPDANTLYIQMMSAINSIIKKNKKEVTTFIQSILPLEVLLLQGILPRLRKKLSFSYIMIYYYVNHAMELKGIYELIKWIPLQEATSTKSLFIALTVICVCEKFASSKRKPLFEELRNLISGLEPEVIIGVFVRVLGMGYVFDDKEHICLELRRFSDKFFKKLSGFKVKVTDDKQIKYATLIASFASLCLANRKIIEKCTTELTPESSMSGLAPAYILLVLMHNKANKEYKKNNTLKQHKELIRTLKSTIEKTESMLSRSCVCELARALLNWKAPENIRATIRVLRVAVNKTDKAWHDSQVQLKLLLEDIVTNLNVFAKEETKNNKQILVTQLLIAICSNVIPMQNKELEELCLKRIPNALELLLEHKAIKSALLFTTIYLCYSALFKTYATEMVLHIELLIENIKNSLATAIKALKIAIKNTEDYHSNSTIILACMKTLLALTETVPRFLDPYMTEIVRAVVALPSIHLELQLSLAKAIGKNIQPKVVLLGLAENYEIYQRLEESIQVRNYLIIMETACSHITNAYVGANYKSIFDLFLLLLPYSEFYFSLHNVDHPHIELIEDYITSALSAFVLKLNGHQFKDVFLNFVTWAQKSKGDKLRHSIIFIKSTTRLINEVLLNLFVPYLSNYQQFLIEILTTTIQHVDHIEVYKVSYSLLMKLATEHVQALFNKNTDQAIDNDSFQMIVVPVVGQLGILELTKDYVLTILGPCLISMIDSINSEEAWKFAFNLILMKTRSEESIIRLNSIRVMSLIVDKLQDRILGLLTEIVPFAAECLEDENDEVITTSKQLLQTFEQITGESIDKFLR